MWAGPRKILPKITWPFSFTRIWHDSQHWHQAEPCHKSPMFCLSSPNIFHSILSMSNRTLWSNRQFRTLSETLWLLSYWTTLFVSTSMVFSWPLFIQVLFLASFVTWFPEVAALYSFTMLQFKVQDNLIHNFLLPNFPFAAATLNLGDQSVMDWHLDFLNLVFGICCIVIFGSFDHHCSAQLMLLELWIIIELQHGDIFFLSFACITHHESCQQV